MAEVQNYDFNGNLQVDSTREGESTKVYPKLGNTTRIDTSMNSDKFNKTYEEVFRTYPGYSHSNGNYNSYFEWFTTLFVPGKTNTLLQRTKRAWNEKVYPGYAYHCQKIITFCSIITIILTCIIIHYSYASNINVKQVYVFDNPADESNAEKKKKLDKLNEVTGHSAFTYMKFAAAIGAAVVSIYQIGKRTTDPNPKKGKAFRIPLSNPFSRKTNRRNAVLAADANTDSSTGSWANKRVSTRDVGLDY